MGQPTLKMPTATFLMLGWLAANPAYSADFTTSDICKAAISVMMGREAKTMKATQKDQGDISYRRADGETFKYRCKLVGDHVVWKTFLNDTREWGRWREQYSQGDAQVTYAILGDTLRIDSDQAYSQSFKPSSF